MKQSSLSLLLALASAKAAAQQRTLTLLLTAEGPVSETNRNNPIPSNMQDTPTKGLIP